MAYRDITIQSLVLKKGKPDIRCFRCQLLELGSKRAYLLSETKRDLLHTHFSLTPNCKVIDGEDVYRVQDIWYSPRPKHPIFTVYKEPAYLSEEYDDSDDSYDGYGVFF